MSDTNIVFIEDFGGKVNDSTFDNSQPFLNAISYLRANGGGTVQLRSGIYYFSTPIEISTPLVSIKIKGTGMYGAGSVGTLLNWSGSGYFLKLKDGGQYYEISDFTLLCNDNYGLSLQQGSSMMNFKSRLKDLFIKNALRSINIGGYAYFFIDNVSVLTSNPNTEYGLSLGESGETREFIYVQNSSFDASDASNGDAIIINGSNDIYLQNVDLCNWGTGKALNVKGIANLYNLYIENTNIIRCDGGIYFDPREIYMTHIILDKINLTFRGVSTTERGIYCAKSGTGASHLTVKNFKTRRIGSVNPMYCVYFEDGAIIGNKESKVEVIDSDSRVHLGTAGVIINADIPFFNKYRNFTLTGDGSKTVFDCVFSTASPLGYNPVIVFNTSLPMPFATTVSNTEGGILKATLTFATSPSSGTFYAYGIIGGAVGW